MTEDEWNGLSLSERRAIRDGLSELGRAACDYADMGLAVFPGVPRGKEPHIQGGFTNAVAGDWELCAWWWSEHPDDNVLIATGEASGGVCVTDIDQNPDKGKFGESTVDDWEAENGKLPETVCCMTGSGGTHLYYMKRNPGRSIANQVLCVDLRENGGYVVAPPSVHPNGNRYEWDLDPCEYQFAEPNESLTQFHVYLDAMRPTSTQDGAKFELPETVHDGEGREDTLMRYAFSMRAHGMEYDEIYGAMAEYNARSIIPPKRPSDLRRIAKSACKKAAGLSPEYKAMKERAERERAERAEMSTKAPDGPTEAPQGPEKAFTNKRGRIQHDVVGRDMVDRLHACFIDGAPAIWRDGQYRVGWDEVKRTVDDYKPSATESERREVVSWLLLHMPRESMGDRRLIAFSNGVLNIETGEMAPNDPSMRITNVIPHEWDPTAHSDEVDAVLRRIACDDEDVLANLYEIIGLCCYRGRSFSKVFVMTNRAGSNGKSTFINFLRYVIGRENCSAVEMQQLGGRFNTQQMMGKTANIADDIPSEMASSTDLSVLKKVATGDVIGYEIKMGALGDFRPYCTLVFSMNKLPTLGDVTGGMMRRLHNVPFNASFRPGVDGFDPFIEERLSTEEAARHALHYGVNALYRCLKRGDVTKTAYSEAELEEIELNNNSAKQFLYDVDLMGRDNLTGKSTADLYQRYQDWALGAGIRNMFSRRKFTNEVKALTGAVVMKRREGEKVHWTYI